MARVEAWVTSVAGARSKGWALVPAALLAVIFLLDLSQPADVIFSMLYVVPIVLTIGIGYPRATYLVFVLSSVATVAAAAFGAPAVHPSAAFTNRGLALLAQVLAAAVVIQQLELRQGQLLAGQEQTDELRQARSAAQRAYEQMTNLQSLITTLPIGLFVLDAAGMIVDVNQAALRLIGLEGDRVRGRSWHSLMSLLDPRAANGQHLSASALTASSASDSLDILEMGLVLRQASTGDPVRCVLTAVPLQESGSAPHGSAIVVRDVTARWENERQKDEFISMAAHELRAPLSALRGYVQLAQAVAQHGESSDLGAVLGKTLRQVDRLNRMIGELLDVSRLQVGQIDLQYSPINAEALAREIVEHHRAAAPSRNIELVVETTLPAMRADAQRLEQVLANLLDNALKYSPDGGPVRVVLRYADGNLHVGVTDHGLGIPQVEQDRLFQRFYRGRSGAHRFSGLGVGLYISNQIVERHGGRMWVTSAPKQGSTFGFTLPINPAPPTVRLDVETIA